MIISHKYKFIFIKTVKTAGTSIEVFLSPHAGADAVVTPITPSVPGHEPRNYTGFRNPAAQFLRRVASLFSGGARGFGPQIFYNHMPGLAVRQQVSGKVWDSYFKFCVERNPWDKVLSHYHMHAARSDRPLSLDEYLGRGVFPINYPRYTDESGTQIILDRILRYEQLNGELGEVFARLGIPFSGSLNSFAKSEYRTDRTPYQRVFNESQREIVERAFAKEIALHGYRFEPKSESKA